MPRHELFYPKEVFNTVKRYNDRASYALQTIHGIINSAHLLHVAFQTPDLPFPSLLPMIGQMGSFARPSADLGDVLDLYLHGYVSSRLVNLARTATPPEGEAAGASPSGLPLSAAASHVDGLVLALSPNSHSYNYRSAVLFGHATLVSDPAERLWAMQLITDSVVPGRWSHTRVPPNGAEMQSTAVLRVRIAGGSAKSRAGLPHDAACDLDDPAVLGRVWAGVLPVHMTLDAPIPAAYNAVAAVPDHVTAFRRDFNEAAAEQARQAAEEPADQ